MGFFKVLLMPNWIVWHFSEIRCLWSMNCLVKCFKICHIFGNEKENKIIWIFLFQKYGKFWSISLGNFIKQNPLIFEDCCASLLWFLKENEDFNSVIIWNKVQSLICGWFSISRRTFYSYFLYKILVIL